MQGTVTYLYSQFAGLLNDAGKQAAAGKTVEPGIGAAPEQGIGAGPLVGTPIFPAAVVLPDLPTGIAQPTTSVN